MNEIIIYTEINPNYYVVFYKQALRYNGLPFEVKLDGLNQEP